MELRVLDKNDEQMKISFVLKGANATFANLLRRYIIEKVPTMAMEDIEIKDNSSALYDEVIAHRLGLIPLSTDLKSYVPIYKCKCDGEGCNRCTLKLTLKAEGPGIVNASEIKSKDPKVKPVFPKMPIVKLLKDQKIELVATAVLGQGNDHVKFSPGFSYYKFKPEITIVKNSTNAEVQESSEDNVSTTVDESVSDTSLSQETPTEPSTEMSSTNQTPTTDQTNLEEKIEEKPSYEPPKQQSRLWLYIIIGVVGVVALLGGIYFLFLM